jgi:hypothetical protein
LLVGGYEIGKSIKARFQPFRSEALRLIAAASQALPAIAILLRAQSHIMFGQTSVIRYGSVAMKAVGLLTPIYFPGRQWVVLAYVALAFIGAAVVFRWRPAAEIWPAIATIGFVALLVPSVFLNVWGSDFRLPFVFAIVVIASLPPGALSARPAGYVALAVLFILVLARASDAVTILKRLDVQETDIRKVDASLPPGQRLLIVESPNEAPGRVARPMLTANLGMLAAIDRNAFVPFLFVDATAVDIRTSMLNSASPNSWAVSFGNFREGAMPARAGPLPGFGDGGRQYWLGWPDKFDYVLILHFGDAVVGLPPRLSLVAESGVASLYRIGAR